MCDKTLTQACCLLAVHTYTMRTDPRQHWNPAKSTHPTYQHPRNTTINKTSTLNRHTLSHTFSASQCRSWHATKCTECGHNGWITYTEEVADRQALRERGAMERTTGRTRHPKARRDNTPDRQKDEETAASKDTNFHFYLTTSQLQQHTFKNGKHTHTRAGVEPRSERQSWGCSHE